MAVRTIAAALAAQIASRLRFQPFLHNPRLIERGEAGESGVVKPQAYGKPQVQARGGGDPSPTLNSDG